MRKTPGSVLPASFFDRPTLEVARDLLGKWIVTNTRTLMITEVEAYDGPRDRASHASRGMTARTKVMFGPPGVFYVYFIYGMHWMANIVTGPKDYPAAVLLRAGVVPGAGYGTEHGEAAAKDTAQRAVHIKGPALLARHLGITGAVNGRTASTQTGIWFENRDPGQSPFSHAKIVASKRIGVDYAGPVWSAKRYNFTLRALTPKRPRKSPGRRGTHQSTRSAKHPSRRGA